MTQDQIAAPSERLRPVTWRVWLAWLLVSALDPVLSSIYATASGKQISRNAEHTTLIGTALLGTVLVAFLAAPILQGLVLKRVLPKLSLWLWFFGIMLSDMMWLALAMSRRTYGLIDAGLRTPSQLQAATYVLPTPDALNTVLIFVLAWGLFLLWTIALSTLTSFVPALMLGIASGRRRATVWFLAAAIAGACVSAIAEQTYLMSVDRRPIHDWALNGMLWTQRFQILTVRGGAGAIWGATTALVVMWMMRRPEDAVAGSAPFFAAHRGGGRALLLIAPLLIAVLTPLAGYLAGPNGLVIGAPALRRALSFAPSQDRSQGETVLAYSHDIDVPTGRYANAAIAPDGQTAIVRSADGKLMQVDLATGRSIRQLGDAIAAGRRHAVVWSPDGRFLALRSNARVRLYLLPDLKLAGDFSSSQARCPDTYAREPMLFSKDSASLWIVCGQFDRSKGDDAMAARLDVPSMQLRDVRRYGHGAESGPVEGLERIGDSLWAWQAGNRGTSFRIRDLTQDREIVAVQPPTPLVGGLTAQSGVARVNEKTIQLTFCGAPPEGPADASPKSWICRVLTFDTQTGALTGSADERDFRVQKERLSFALSGHGLRIEAFWRHDSKTGEIVVRDGATGRERQRIVSIAQRPLQLSADGRWLLTAGVEGGPLRLYRMQP